MGDPLNKAQRLLVEGHLELVGALAARWRARCRSTVDHADLVQVGALALVEAARRFDPERNVAFGAMAARRVQGAIRDHLRGLDPLSRRQRGAVRELRREQAALGTELGRKPTAEELADRLGAGLDHVREVRSLETSLDQGWAQTREASEAGDLPIPQVAARAADPLGELLSREAAREVSRALARLPEREARVLRLRYQDGLTQSEVGHRLGVSGSRACQIEARAVRRLRRRLGPRMSCVPSARPPCRLRAPRARPPVRSRGVPAAPPSC